MREPVYIRSDFDNVYVELSRERVEKVIAFAREQEREGLKEEDESNGE